MLTNKRNILITGISRGIGLQLARALLEKGDRVIGISRSPYDAIPISDIAREDYFSCDLSNSHDVEKTANSICSAAPELNIIIHNAALGFYGGIEEQKNINSLLNANLLAPLLLTRTLSSNLINAVDSRVIFISSVHSLFPTPYFAAYTASKCALEGFARNLREEWRGKVEVQVLYVGVTATDMHRAAGMPNEKLSSIKGVAPSLTAKKIVTCLDQKPHWKTLSIRDSILRITSRIVTPILDRTNIRLHQ